MVEAAIPQFFILEKTRATKGTQTRETKAKEG